jgi:hypothetical protein
MVALAVTAGLRSDLMYMVVFWQRLVEPSAETRILSDELKLCLKGKSWVKPVRLADLYFMRVATAKERDGLKAALVGVCSRSPGLFHLVVSPALADGDWGGMLPKDIWPKLKSRTNPPREK